MNEVTPALPANGSAKSPERRVRHGLIEDWRDAIGILLLLLVAAFFGAVIARFWPESDDTHAVTELTARLTAIEATQSKPASDVAALKDRMSKLEQRLSTTEAALASGALPGNLAAAGIAAGAGIGPTPGSAIAPTAVAEHKLIEDLATRLAAIETKAPDIQATKDGLATLTTGVTELTTRIDTFGERIAKIESSDLIVLARRASMATAVANLMRAAQGSSPFKTEYEAVAAVSSDAALSEIKPYVGGLPTTGTLIAMFGKASDAALDAEQLANSGGSMWSGLWANFMATISARPTGEVAGNSSAERIARAEVRMKAGDLAAAVKELGAIRGAAREPLQPWLAQASARVKLETALAKLNNEAVAALSGTASSDPVPQLPTP